jgi:hypothetical protein
LENVFCRLFEFLPRRRKIGRIRGTTLSKEIEERNGIYD